MNHSRQISFIGKEKQNKISKSSIAIVGVGALGTVCSELLCRAGVRELLLWDFDNVDETNLHRQLLYDTKDLKKPKVESAKKKLELINPDVKIKVFNDKINSSNIYLVKADVVIDCLDDLNVKLILNSHCVKNKIPLIHGSAAENKGYVFVVHPDNGSPCLNCIYESNMISQNCQVLGVMNTITTAIAAFQVNEAIKIITGQDYEHDLLRIDLQNNKLERIKIKQKKGCVCDDKDPTASNISNNHAKPIPEYTIKRCKTKAVFEVNPHKKMKLDFDKLKKNFEVIADTPMILIISVEVDGNPEEVIVYENGSLMFKTLNDTEKVDEIVKRIYGV